MIQYSAKAGITACAESVSISIAIAPAVRRYDIEIERFIGREGGPASLLRYTIFYSRIVEVAILQQIDPAEYNLPTGNIYSMYIYEMRLNLRPVIKDFNAVYYIDDD